MTNDGVYVHPAGLCESSDVGAGTRVWAFAHVMPGAVVGSDCNICDSAFVEGGARIGSGVTVKNGVLIWTGVTIEDEVFLGPGVTFTNDLRPRAHRRLSPEELVATTVARGATIGANATIVCGTTVGTNAFIAAGSVVTRDIAAHALVAGNPAVQIGWVCRCGGRLDRRFRCPGCGATHGAAASGAGLQATSTAPDPPRSALTSS